MFRIFKTRENLLRDKIKQELSSDRPDLEKIIIHINEYEKNNLDTIEKLKRDKVIDTKRINGALKTTINAHGAITKQYISSATKRIYGALLTNTKKENIITRIIKWIS
jgi:hypothetical protein